MASGDFHLSRGRDANPVEWQSKFDKAVGQRDTDALDWLLRIPPAGGVLPSRPRDPAVEFGELKPRLLQSLRAGPPILPYALVQAWIPGVAQLDLRKPGPGLDLLAEMASGYVQAIENYYAGYSPLMRPAGPPEAVGTIGRQIDRLGSLLYFVLATS